MTDNNITKANECDNATKSGKIKAIYPHIVVSGNIDNLYYSIQWYDIEKKSMQDGYGSYTLENVRQWLKDDFDVIDDDIDNLINRLETENSKLQAENKGLTKEKEKAWELFKKKCDEDIELQSLCDKRRLEIERLKEKTRNVFTGVINKFLGLEDLYVIVEGDFVPWEPTEEVEHLFEISLSGEDEELVNDIDKGIKEMVGEDG